MTTSAKRSSRISPRTRRLVIRWNGRRSEVAVGLEDRGDSQLPLFLLTAFAKNVGV
jgi:hypothetical protein